MSEKQPSHTYSIALRFYDENLDIDKISTKLNLPPSYALTQADIDKTPKLKRTPHWNFTAKGFNGFQDEWENLEEGLRFLIEILKPQKSQIIELSQKFNAVWWIGHFQNSFDGGYTLSASLMKQLSEFQVPMYVDSYFSTAWEDE